MTRRPIESRRAKKPKARNRAAHRPKARGQARFPDNPEPWDDFIAAGARALDLKIDTSWLPAVRSHLQVTLRHGALVAVFPLADDAEPAPVFEA